MPTLGVLTSPHLPHPVDEKTLAAAARELGLSVHTWNAEHLRSLDGCDLVVNLLGPHFPEKGWGVIHDYYEKGGTLLSLGAFAFSVPFAVRDGELKTRFRTDAALHSFGLIDCYQPVPDMLEPSAIEYEAGALLLEPGDGESFPPLVNLCAMEVRVATRPERPQDLYASRGRVEARYRACIRARDAGGRPTWAPLVRLDHYHKGSLVFLNGSPKDPGFWQTDYGRRFLQGLLLGCLRPQFEVRAESRFARYYPGEERALEVEVRQVGGLPPPKVLSLKACFVHESGDELREEPFHEMRLHLHSDHQPYVIPIPRREAVDEEGYHVMGLYLEAGGDVYHQCFTACYVYSDETIRGLMDGVEPVTLRPHAAPDFCFRGDEVWPMHGTTYTVSGRYRDCFQNHNVWTCVQEMAELRQAGVNVLRTGIWTGYERVFNDDGTFRERSLRALDAWFLTAAHNNLPVHFVFAAFVMNHWDRSRDPFHDPVLLRRIEHQFKQFTERYCGWPHILMDLINEPSYAPYQDGLLWQIARPYNTETEWRAWRDWLKERYQSSLSALRRAWNLTEVELPAWDSVRVPARDQFLTNYDGPGDYDDRVMVNDFLRFATDSFTRWAGRIRALIREIDPERLVLIGRDETIRVPTQQEEHAAGNIDFLNWHQWHREGNIYVEYVLNRVRGVPLCGQEHGVLFYKNPRREERLTEQSARNILERKLLYSFGNWIQWQAYSDVSMDNIKESRLGLFRADCTERPCMDTFRLLAWFEEATARWRTGRREDDEDLCVLHPTSLYYSSDHPLAYRAVLNCVTALQYHLKRQPYVVLEPLFRPGNDSHLGDPNLILVPSPLLLEEETWQHLLSLMRDGGKTVLLSGSIETDPRWVDRTRFMEAGLNISTAPVATRERLSIGRKKRHVSFRDAVHLNLPGKVLNKAVLHEDDRARVRVLPVGKGRLILCPIPVELGDSIRPVVDLYEFALDEAPLHKPLVEVPPRRNSPAQFIHAIAYADATVVTVINEGPAAEIEFTETVSGTTVKMRVDQERGACLVVSRSGDVLGAFLHGDLTVGESKYRPGGDLAFVRDESEYRFMPGTRDVPRIVLDGARVDLNQDALFHVRSVPVPR